MRIEGFANSFSDSGSVAISVFVAQNRGAGDKERAKSGLKQGWTVMFGLAVILSILMVISISYFLCFTGSSFVGFFRGIGRVEVPVIGTIIQISIRVVISYSLIGMMGLKAVALATGIGWAAVVLYQIITYRKVQI